MQRNHVLSFILSTLILLGAGFTSIEAEAAFPCKCTRGARMCGSWFYPDTKTRKPVCLRYTNNKNGKKVLRPSGDPLTPWEVKKWFIDTRTGKAESPRDYIRKERAKREQRRRARRRHKAGVKRVGAKVTTAQNANKKEYKSFECNCGRRGDRCGTYGVYETPACMRKAGGVLKRVRNLGSREASRLFEENGFDVKEYRAVQFKKNAAKRERLYRKRRKIGGVTKNMYEQAKRKALVFLPKPIPISQKAVVVKNPVLEKEPGPDPIQPPVLPKKETPPAQKPITPPAVVKVAPIEREKPSKEDYDKAFVQPVVKKTLKPEVMVQEQNLKGKRPVVTYEKLSENESIRVLKNGKLDTPDNIFFEKTCVKPTQCIRKTVQKVNNKYVPYEAKGGNHIVYIKKDGNVVSLEEKKITKVGVFRDGKFQSNLTKKKIPSKKVESVSRVTEKEADEVNRKNKTGKPEKRAANIANYYAKVKSGKDGSDVVLTNDRPELTTVKTFKVNKYGEKPGEEKIAVGTEGYDANHRVDSKTGEKKDYRPSFDLQGKTPQEWEEYNKKNPSRRYGVDRVFEEEKGFSNGAKLAQRFCRIDKYGWDYDCVYRYGEHDKEGNFIPNSRIQATAELVQPGQKNKPLKTNVVSEKTVEREPLLDDSGQPVLYEGKPVYVTGCQGEDSTSCAQHFDAVKGGNEITDQQEEYEVAGEEFLRQPEGNVNYFVDGKNNLVFEYHPCSYKKKTGIKNQLTSLANSWTGGRVDHTPYEEKCGATKKYTLDKNGKPVEITDTAGLRLFDSKKGLVNKIAGKPGYLGLEKVDRFQLESCQMVENTSGYPKLDCKKESRYRLASATCSSSDSFSKECLGQSLASETEIHDKPGVALSEGDDFDLGLSPTTKETEDVAKITPAVTEGVELPIKKKPEIPVETSVAVKKEKPFFSDEKPRTSRFIDFNEAKLGALGKKINCKSGSKNRKVKLESPSAYSSEDTIKTKLCKQPQPKGCFISFNEWASDAEIKKVNEIYNGKKQKKCLSYQRIGFAEGLSPRFSAMWMLKDAELVENTLSEQSSLAPTETLKNNCRSNSDLAEMMCFLKKKQYVSKSSLREGLPFGNHFYITKKGCIVELLPMDLMGAHTGDGQKKNQDGSFDIIKNSNFKKIGVLFESKNHASKKAYAQLKEILAGVKPGIGTSQRKPANKQSSLICEPDGKIRPVAVKQRSAELGVMPGNKPKCKGQGCGETTR